MTRGVTILGGILAISLALNLFWAASLIGREFRPRPDPQQDMNTRLTAMWEDLPAADQPIVRDIVGRHHDEILQKWDAVRFSAMHAHQALRATPFQNDVVEDVRWAKRNQRSTEFRGAVQDMQVEAAAKISPEGRLHLRWRGP